MGDKSVEQIKPKGQFKKFGLTKDIRSRKNFPADCVCFDKVCFLRTYLTKSFDPKNCKKTLIRAVFAIFWVK